MSQIPLKKLMKDPIFRKWMAQVPSGFLGQTRWRVWVKRKKKGPWGKIDFATYPEAYRWMAKNLSEYHDMAIHSLARLHRPPRTRVKTGTTAQGLDTYRYKDWQLPAGHGWCGLCRRPVVFAYFSKHHFWTHVGKPWVLDGATRLCPICGGRESFVDVTRRKS